MLKTRFDKGEAGNICLDDLTVRLVDNEEDKATWNQLVAKHHYLHDATLVGRHLRYVVSCRGKAVSLLSFSSCAYHLAARDKWIGWNQAQMAQRRHLVVANSRFLILPGISTPNLASKSLALCLNRLSADWMAGFGHPLLAVETFTEQRFPGTSYKADNWLRLGATQGFKRDGEAFYIRNGEPKTIWVKELRKDARKILSTHKLPPDLVAHERPATANVLADVLGKATLGSLYDTFSDVYDPRRMAARTQRMGACLSIIVLGFLCGCEGLSGCAVFGRNLKQAQLMALGVRRDRKTKKFRSPCHATLWHIMNKVDPAELSRRISAWTAARNGTLPECIAIDGKTLRGSEDSAGRAMHVITAISHTGHTPFLRRRQPTAKDVKAKPCATSLPNKVTSTAAS